MKLSFIIPCYRSEKTVADVCRELTEKMAEKPEYDYEIILVNDCSPDGVLSVIQGLCRENAQIKGIDLAKNVGKHSALMAGYRLCTGDYIVCLDDDGQCPADRLWDLIAPLDDDADVCLARYGVKNQSNFKNFGSRMNAWMMTHLLGKPRDLQFANFFAMKRFVVEEMLNYSGSFTYINGLILRTTRHIVNVPMEERARTQGTGGYTFSKSLKLWMNGFTAFSVAPLRLSVALGVLCDAVAVILVLAAIIGACVGAAGWVSTALIVGSVFFLGGLILLMMGLMGEYVGRIYLCINNAPQYVIRSKFNFTEHE